MKKKTIILHSLLVLLELIALVHDIRVFGAGLFQYYTINSNILQMLVSGCIVYFLLQKKRIPSLLASLHLVCAVCLTVTFMIAALVLNAARLLDGPYFFLRVHDEPASTVILWFAVIAVLCLALSAFYLWCRKKRASGTERMHSGNAG